MPRYENWETRLSEFLEECIDKPFKRGQHDCALFAANCINVVRNTKEDIGKEFRIDYKNRQKAVELLKKKGFANLEAVATKKLGPKYPSAKFGKRGDCVSVKCSEGIALAIVDLTGKRAVTTGKNGLEYYSINEWLNAWEV